MKSLSEIVAENEHVAVDAIVDSLDRASVTFPATTSMPQPTLVMKFTASVFAMERPLSMRAAESPAMLAPDTAATRASATRAARSVSVAADDMLIVLIA